MLGSQIKLRVVTPEDIHFLGQLFRDTRRQEVSTWGWTEEQLEAFLRAQFDAQRRSYRAAFPEAEDHILYVEDVAAGRLLINRGSQELHLIDIALFEKYRNSGAGTELIHELQRECERELLILRLQVKQGNPALRLYQRLGFVSFHSDPMYLQMEWIPLDFLRSFRSSERF
jgi:ribosomal protein S18 acetylase RimI-like enzyme